MNTNSYFAKLIETKLNTPLEVYIFEDEENVYTFSIDFSKAESWVLDENAGPLLAEMLDTNHYGEIGVNEKGFNLFLDGKDIKFEVINPEKVNVGMLKGLSDIDPLAMTSFKKDSK